MSQNQKSALETAQQGYIEDNNDFLQRMRTAGSVQLPAELFEQLYLAPQNRVKGHLRQTFGNPTPIALGGFLMCSTSLSMALLGWQGAGGLGAANLGAYLYVGGVTQFLGAIGEWILGNTFPAVVFFLFGGFWLAFGTAIDPTTGASAVYSPDPKVPAEGLVEPAFFATFGFFLVTLAIVVAFFTIASLRTNLVFFMVFLTLTPSGKRTFRSYKEGTTDAFTLVCCLAAAFFALASGLAAAAATYQHVGAILLLVVSLMGWYIFLSLILLAVDFPFWLPMGDLSTIIKGFNDKKTSEGDV
ncbi:uncharacterized protein N7446_013889 [Penicillium canescens]|uniref:GPR1/FUN34/YaaH-class plasma membrane protein n=1 Tax=Penicillium canescens TaxID=5083 RepID=A0AAD6HZT2_PENCN|nr:uncharacterized protein N7446_013889 [Penicillium canescens]KAJ6023524.1 hypothetical protein N7460_013919 [Penicillium canescens]KAJ6025201.1 hypothetical protein N7444_012880 [Penicillium canescens]KAJ6042823.1 hypothetical protein N7446_013889 [Penicillium canescens]